MTDAHHLSSSNPECNVFGWNFEMLIGIVRFWYVSADGAAVMVLLLGQSYAMFFDVIEFELNCCFFVKYVFIVYGKLSERFVLLYKSLLRVLNWNDDQWAAIFKIKTWIETHFFVFIFKTISHKNILRLENISVHLSIPFINWPAQIVSHQNNQ